MLINIINNILRAHREFVRKEKTSLMSLFYIHTSVSKKKFYHHLK